MSDVASPPPSVPAPGGTSDALRFWERGRLLFNAVLVLVVIGSAAFSGQFAVLFDFSLVLLILALVANALYCLAYPIDLLMRNSAFAEFWLRTGRYILLGIGILLGAWFAIGVMLGPMVIFPPWD